MARGKDHSEANGAIFQWGYNPGQPGRMQLGLCANSLKFPELHELIAQFAKGSWAILMALNPQHCKDTLERVHRTGAPCLEGTGSQAFAVSLNYQDPCHRDSGDRYARILFFCDCF